MIPSQFGYTIGSQNSEVGKSIRNDINELKKQLEYYPIKQPEIRLKPQLEDIPETPVRTILESELTAKSPEHSPPRPSSILPPKVDVQKFSKKVLEDQVKNFYTTNDKILPSFADIVNANRTSKKLVSRDRFDSAVASVMKELKLPESPRLTPSLDSRARSRSRKGDGKFSNWKKGLYDTDIEKILISKTKRFVPVIMADEIPKLLPYINKGTKDFGFIINSSPSNQEGRHWRACYIDFEKGEIDYYDSLVSQPSKQFLKDIKLLIDKVNPNFYLKLKVNMIKDQSDSTNNCGFFCIKFIEDMIRGKKFKYACNCDEAKLGEYEIEKFKNYL
jgi:hypothetical protein